jgi:hypothetical protein
MSVPGFIANYNGNGHVPPPDAGDNGFGGFSGPLILPSDYEPAPVDAWKPTPKHTPSWRDHEPPYLHTLKWFDKELGIEHLCCIRASNVDELWLEVRKVMALIKASKARQAEEQSRVASNTPSVAVTTTTPPPTGSNPAPVQAEEPELTHCHLHGGVFMRLYTKNGHEWRSHRLADGTWCRGGK